MLLLGLLVHMLGRTGEQRACAPCRGFKPCRLFYTSPFLPIRQQTETPAPRKRCMPQAECCADASVKEEQNVRKNFATVC